MSSNKSLSLIAWIVATLAVAGTLTAGAVLAERHVQPLIVAAHMPATIDPSGVGSLAAIIGTECQSAEGMVVCSH